MNRSPLFFPSLVFIFGVGAGSFLVVPPWGIFLVAAVALGMVGIFPSRKVLSVSVVVGCFVIGVLLVREEIDQAQAVLEISGRVSGEAEAVSLPKRKDAFQEVVFRFDRCREGECPAWRVLLRAPLAETYTYGDRVNVSCPDLSIPENFSDDFDYRMYLVKDGIGYLCDKGSMKRISTQSVFSGLFGFSRRFEESLAKSIPEPEAGLAVGIILGGDDRFPEEVRGWFRGAGLSHIVAVSGYNITILSFAFLFLGIFFFLSRKRAIVFALAAAFVFVFLAGMPSSGVRALAMAGVVFLATLLGRRSASVPALVFAGAWMLFLNPLLFRYDVGFQLSFLATLGIVLFSPYARLFTDRIRSGKLFIETAFLTVSAELLILPIIFGTFGTFPLLAIVSNVLLLPLIPPAMFFSFLAGLLGMVSGALGELFAFPAYVLLHAVIEGARWFSGVEVGRITLAHFGWVEGLAWYAAVFGLLYFLKRSMKQEKSGV